MNIIKEHENTKKMVKKQTKKAAMELSIGTIVILVLAMTMLVLGIILIRSIFASGTNAISAIDSGVKSEIQKTFSTEGAKIVVYPTSRQVDIKKGAQAEGFAFSVKNLDVSEKSFTWEVKADTAYDYKTKCPGIIASDADSWMEINTGSFTLAPGNSLDNEILVLFTIPRDAPPCSIPFNINVREGTKQYAATNIFLRIK
ncbi:MAG: hypothetical protein WC438_00610 [Candidatus Pacearchaeota archaeon]